MSTPAFVPCAVHGQPFPRVTCHEHHEVPRAAGGNDAETNLVWLCSNCHNVLHRIADMLRAGKHGHAQDAASTYATSPIMRERLWGLAIFAAESMEEGEGPDVVPIQVFMPKALLGRLKIAAGETRVNGRSMGMGRFVLELIKQDLRRRKLL